MIGWSRYYSSFRKIIEVNGEKYLDYRDGLKLLSTNDYYVEIREEQMQNIIRKECISYNHDNYRIDSVLLDLEEFKKGEKKFLEI